jgi:hypothetical protein
MESTVTMSLKEYNKIINTIDVLKQTNEVLRDCIAKELTLLERQKDILRSKGLEPDDIKITVINTKMDLYEKVLKETKMNLFDAMMK